MKTFPTNIKFKYSWRRYQERVLDELEAHLDDNHLHIIAPPGSGKTVLGLEVMLRLNKPTLIVAPTIAIRNQWIQRFCELFLQVADRPNWISRDIKQPKFLTVATYQGLHATSNGNKELEEDLEELEVMESINAGAIVTPISLQQLIQLLKIQHIGTIIVDEAHHLKNEWWKTLMAIKKALSPTIVGLTATPPYDVSFQEWQRYLTLNGPIDSEISVPELVLAGDLCPHQDYIHFSRPTGTELEKITSHRKNIQALYDEFAQDPRLLNYLNSFPAIIDPENHLNWIYSNMEVYSSFLIYLTHNKINLSPYHLSLTGNQKLQLPKLDLEWLQVVIAFILKQDTQLEDQYKDFKATLISALRRNGALEKNRVALTTDNKIERYLKSSLGKLDSIIEIVRFEFNHLKDDLRLVILGDYIRKEYLSPLCEINKLGIVPIFETLRRQLPHEIKIGVLTGSLIIIPKSALFPFMEIAKTYGINKANLHPLDYDLDYLIISPSGQIKHDLVAIITQLFESGGIHVLTGTKSLLGEGWDAPSINTLILASFVGSFVLSNQMRGRAIRTIKANKAKTSNIWHLVCLDPTKQDGGNDLALLERRFKSFVGISERENKTIENGLTRILSPNSTNNYPVKALNTRMLQSAINRDGLRNQWREAIKNGTILIEEIKFPFIEGINYKKLKRFYFNTTIAYFLAELGSAIAVFSTYLLEFAVDSADIESIEDLFTWLSIFGVVGLIFFGNRLLKSATFYFKYRDIAKDIHSIAKALLTTLIETQILQSNPDKLDIKVTINEFGEVFCHMEGGSTYEKSTFINALEEIVEPVTNPRYLIIRKNYFWNLIPQKDYHQVPECLGKNKMFANQLASNWKKYVGNCALVFTRNAVGRSVLLKARFDSLAAALNGKPERMNRWK